MDGLPSNATQPDSVANSCAFGFRFQGQLSKSKSSQPREVAASKLIRRSTLGGSLDTNSRYVALRNVNHSHVLVALIGDAKAVMTISASSM